MQLEAEVKRAQRDEENKLKKLLNKENPGFLSTVGLDNCKIMWLMSVWYYVPYIKNENFL